MKDVLGVIGAGVMGIGVAQVFAQSGYDTILIDLSEERLAHAKQKIYESLRFRKLYNKGKENLEDASYVLKRISFEIGYKNLRNTSIVIENVTENIDIKKNVYKEIDHVCNAECIFGVNTSAISITQVASFTKRPHKVIGMHFMNPVPLIQMVEVIKGYHTDITTVTQIKNLLSNLGKKCIVINDSPGFVTNRAMMIFINEAIFMLQEQIASAEDIDVLFKQCFGHKMGPLQTADLIGLDTILNSLLVLYEGYNDSKYRPCSLLKKMVDAGLCGTKSGKGFYDYLN